MTVRPKSLLRAVDLNFLNAKIRALRSRIISGPAWSTLAALPGPLALYQKILDTRQDMPLLDAQRAVISNHFDHLLHILNFTGGAQFALLDWLVRKYQMDNLKVILGAWRRKTPLSEIEADILPAPEAYSLPDEKILAAPEVAVLANLMPDEAFARAIAAVTTRFSQDPRVFYLEAALDKAYYLQALKLAAALPKGNRNTSTRIIKTETLCRNIIFTLRCMQTYNIPTDAVAELVVPHGPFADSAYVKDIGSSRLDRLVEMMPRLAPHAAGRAIASVADLEELLQRYLYRTVIAQYAASVADFGVVVAYYYMKYFELRDVLRLGEALRLGLAPADALSRLLTAGETNV